MLTPESPDFSVFAGRVFDAVLFDNDGTLVNSIEAVEASWLQWAREFDVDPALLSNLHGKPAEATVRSLVAPAIADSAIARISEIELNSPIPTVSLPGAADALAGAAKRCAIVTSAGRALFERRLHEAGLTAPAVTVTVEQVMHGKPNPEPYLRAAELLHVDPTRCLVVEDAPAGVASARAAGAAVLGIAGTAPRELDSPEGLRADAVVPDLSAVRFVSVPGGVSVEVAQ